jgi:hypothetical protein
MPNGSRRMLAVVTLALVSGAQAGCVGSVKLRHPATKQEVTCGPFAIMGGRGVDNLRGCIDDFQRQGYERVPD